MSTKAEALRNMAEHAALMLEGNPPLRPFDMAGQGAKYARTVAATVLAASVLRYVAEIVVDDEDEDAPPLAGACGATDGYGAVCSLRPGHDGDHSTADYAWPAS